MTDEDIKQIVLEKVIEIFELEPDEIEDNASFSDNLGGDSVQKLELIAALEQHFNIYYTGDDAANIDTVNSTVQITKNYI
jgi:acyl carrier protein